MTRTEPNLTERRGMKAEKNLKRAPFLTKRRTKKEIINLIIGRKYTAATIRYIMILFSENHIMPLNFRT